MKKKRKLEKKKNELEDLLPTENVKVYLNIYNAIREMHQTLPQYPKKELRYLERGLRKIGLKDKEVNSIKKELILKCMFNPSAFREMCRALLSNSKDYALDFLIYSLVYDLKCKTGKPNYPLVVRFLNKHGIHKITEYEDIRKRYQRLRFDEIVENIRIFFIIGASYPPLKNAFDGVAGIYPGFLVDCLKEIVASSIFPEYFNSLNLFKRT